ncbi:hypothetical protein OS242_10455 [Tumebacillus sp. DT12]|uniref:YubB ferredoxin-like domain-containing protein n=1 Tax=Tumebacillus lacus TaxID=2995335 RepID=A0ABT3X477_9BACL|nr:hypothetical protein [Tumebacillus lacus]MCX7570385.1 hypothetical protein [Tumebacillus lacus]
MVEGENDTGEFLDGNNCWELKFDFLPDGDAGQVFRCKVDYFNTTAEGCERDWKFVVWESEIAFPVAQSANQTEKFATFVPEIPAGTGPTFVNPADAVIELVADLAELHPAYFECGIRKDELVAEWTEQVKAHKPGETWHPPADCPDNEDYSIEIGEMTDEEYNSMPEFNGY